MKRCWWCGSDPLYIQYHDEEWGKPVKDDNRLFEKVCLEGFQAGLSWITILRKRENFRRAFTGFDIDTVARYRSRDVARLLKNDGIVRHRGKIESTINNARRARELREEEGSLRELFLALAARPRIAAAPDHARSAAEDGDDAGIDGAQQGSPETRMDVRRPDDDLRVHAGDGARQRSR
jgi:DNA-3-methyladenine glycosylase I